MSHPSFTTSQDFTALRFDVTGHCFLAERRADGWTPQNLGEAREPGTLLPFLSLLLGIAVSADVGRAG